MTKSDLREVVVQVFDRALEEFVRDLAGSRFDQSMIDSFPGACKDELVEHMLSFCNQAALLVATKEQVLRVENKNQSLRSAFKVLLKKNTDYFFSRN